MDYDFDFVAGKPGARVWNARRAGGDYKIKAAGKIQKRNLETASGWPVAGQWPVGAGSRLLLVAG